MVGGLAVLGGFIAFYVMEKLMRAGGFGHSHSHSHDHAHAHDHSHGADCCDDPSHDHSHGHDHLHGHSHSHDHEHSQEQEKSQPSASSRRARSPARGTPASERKGLTKRGKSKASAAGASASTSASTPKKLAANANAPASPTAARTDGLTAGYLNLVADAAHNFTDGIALGAGFRSSFGRGVAMTMAVLMHEVPHEVGDVAILMQVGFGKWQAIRAQMVTAVGALLGALVAVSTEQEEAGLLLNFTAGGFIYIATVDVLPQLLHDSSVTQTLKEVCAMAAGIGMMLVVMAFE